MSIENNRLFSSHDELRLMQHSKPVVCVRFSPSRELVATASADKEAFIVRVKDVFQCNDADSVGMLVEDEEIENANSERKCNKDCDTSNRLVHREILRGHELGLNDCKWYNDNILVTCSDDKSIKLWDITTSQVLTTLLGHSSFSHSLCINEPAGLIISGGTDGTMCVHDPRTSTCALKFELAHSDVINSIDCSASTHQIMTCSHDCSLRFWDIAAPRECMASVVDAVPMTSASYCPDHAHILVSSLDSSVALYSVCEYGLQVENENPEFLNGSGESIECLATYKGHKNNRYTVNSLLCELPERGNDKFVVLSGSEDGKLYTWSNESSESTDIQVTTDAVMSSWPGGEGPLLAIDACVIDGRLNVIGGNMKGQVSVWL